MARSKSSKQWLKEHFEDDYVRQSKELGLRSRASFKLLEIQEKDKLFKAGMTVVDLPAQQGHLHEEFKTFTLTDLKRLYGALRPDTKPLGNKTRRETWITALVEEASVLWSDGTTKLWSM